jgi:Raf kinase inhibitor-like YbhB/YbcL family protein
MKLTSPAFKQGGKIPQKYTCQGENHSPALEIADVPPEAKTLALLMDDPDVPKSIRKEGIYIHWIAYNIDPKTKTLPEKAKLADEGINTGGKKGYIGPCPPDGEHRYFFKLYALDTKLSNIATKEDLLKAMEGHILAQAELMGTYIKVKE